MNIKRRSVTPISAAAQTSVELERCYRRSLDDIQSAIDNLATVAGYSDVAIDSIVNLSVILLDLQNLDISELLDGLDEEEDDQEK